MRKISKYFNLNIKKSVFKYIILKTICKYQKYSRNFVLQRKENIYPTNTLT
jgi:hypothetical protein